MAEGPQHALFLSTEVLLVQGKWVGITNAESNSNSTARFRGRMTKGNERGKVAFLITSDEETGGIHLQRTDVDERASLAIVNAHCARGGGYILCSLDTSD